MLDNNVQKQQQAQMQFQSLTPQQQELLRQQIAMQAGNPELLKENIQDTYVANRVSKTTEDPNGMLWTAGLLLPSWFAIAKGMDKYAEHCRGDYEKTIPGKIGAWGDRVSETLGKNSLMQSIGNGYKSFKNFVRTKIVDKSRLLRAFCDTPSKPELSMVRDQARGMLGFCATDWDQVVENFIRETHHVEDLSAYGAKASEIEAYKSRIAKLPKAQQVAELQKAEFELIKKYTRGGNSFILKSIAEFSALDDASRSKLLKDAKAYEFGLKDFAEFELIKNNRPDYLHRIMESAHNANKNMYSIAYEAKPTLWGRFKRFVFGRNVYGSEFANKMASSIGNETLTPEMAKALKDTGLDKKIPKSALGKFIAKYNNIVLEGATNRVAGGKLIAIMQAWFLAEAIYKSAKAEGGAGEKARTFAERLTELVAMFACIPPAIMLMHKVGGLQYAGMTKQQVEVYRQHLKDFNEKALAGTMSKAEWKAGKKALQKELKAGVKNPFTNLFKRIGRIVSVGLEQIRPYQSKASTRKTVMEKIKDMFKSPGHFKFGFKQMAGYPMRIILGMMVIMPFFSKLAIKCCHAIFGKPKNSVLDEDKESKDLQSEQQLQLPPQLQQNPQAMQQQTNPFSVPNGTKPQRTYIPSAHGVQILQDGKSPTNLLTQYQNSQLQSDKKIAPEPFRNYIPSPIGVQINSGENITEADKAMRRADAAEQLALQTLKMN